MTRLQTVVELPEFLRRAKAIMTEEERAALVDFIAANPQGGIALGGGLRKVRFAGPAAARAAADRTRRARRSGRSARRR